MNPWLSSVLSTHLLDRRGGHRRRVIDAWRNKQSADYVHPDRRRAVQAQALADLLNHCRVHVPYYREKLQKHGSISAVNAFDVLQELPVITRADLQSEPRLFEAENMNPAAEDATGGSTGTPLRFKVDHRTQVARESSLMWADGLAGWQLGHRIAMLWGSDRDVRSALRSWRLVLRWWIENRRWHDAFHMNEESMGRFHRCMQRFKPHYLVAYAGALDVYADFLEGHRLRPKYPINALISSAEVLLPAVREKVERVFDRPLYDRYGNREFGAIAAECLEHSGLHLNPHDAIVELLPVVEGEPARRVVITYLHNYVMPFVRYDTEDLAEPDDRPCACGRTTTRLARLVGRRSDIIRLPDGRCIHGEYFTHMFYGASGVRQFQFVQTHPHGFELRIVAAPDAYEQLSPVWRQKLQQTLGPNAQIEIHRVNEIPLTPSGKRRFTISQL